MNSARQPALLDLRGIAKSFPGVHALSDVDFTLHKGEVHALLGENGAGKSTLIKVLTGIHRRDAGTMHLEGQPIDLHDPADAQRLGIGTVYQEVNLLPNLTVAENIYLGRQPTRLGFVDRRRMARDARALLAGYGLDIDVNAALGDFSVAVQQLVAIARAADLSARILILDEPTASLDAQEVATMFAMVRQLKAQGLGIVFVTHFLDQVYEIANRITVLRNGRLVGSHATADLPRLDLVRLMLGKELAEIESADHAHGPGRGGLCASFRDFGKRRYLAPFDLDIHEGEVIGIAGLLGSGRTETAKLIFGIERADRGEVLVDGASARLAAPRDAIALGFGFCPEDRKTEGIVGELSVRENIILALQARRGWIKPIPAAEQKRIAEEFVRRLDIRTTDIEKPIELLSGGNQQKALLARWLATNPRILILDEPTRGIDVGAHAEIIRLIRELCGRGMSLLVISSELDEITVYSDRVVVLADRRHVGELRAAEISPRSIMAAIAGTDAPVAQQERPA
ncbi:monosaccharide ABC transporter ATP-binding protein (CUT2 family) [Dongia mobilis]|uniref:Monosaccharide ABC transporter ATP-binding protein (CUT2 family) n=1 Tax=Dongia mobilis TaxID=578943 RepID=A0A4R6WMU5_9PROT|nr:sugar ABC transporter ATP-binding protein [Dongia mobilis]TDQ82322.1 monosaccharide ABC transporter ATP-binding protein (CUT2 family) [Dongia mobilis]